MIKKRNLILPISAAVLALGALAGCTSPSSSPTSTNAGSQSGSTSIPTIPAGEGIISGTKMTSCEVTGPNVTAKGTVTMPKGKSGNVAISVSWTNSKNASVYGRGVATIKDLKSGDKKEWTTSATIPADAESVSCVLGAVIPQ
jgi:hypothetical protein